MDFEEFMNMDDHGFDDVDAILMGSAGYAMSGALRDKQTKELKGSFNDITVNVSNDDDRPRKLNNAADYPHEGPATWDDYVGQDRVKMQLRVHIEAAQMRNAPLPHILLASGIPGVGKTTLARLVAHEMGGKLIQLVPPFHKSTLQEAAESLIDRDVLFIDEIHKMADNGPAMAEMLLHLMEEGRLYTDDGVVELHDFTLIGATTDAGKLPPAVLSRFPVKPYFSPYSKFELSIMAAQFSGRFGAEDLDDEVLVVVANACRGVPRVARELIIKARDLCLALKRSPKPYELLEFCDMDADGMTRVHKQYLIKLYQHFGRKGKDGIEYVAGEATMMELLRETKQGLADIERFLIEEGHLDKTRSGRKLTERGIERAQMAAMQEDLDA